MHHDDEYILEALKRGAIGYLNKHVAPQELLDSIRSALIRTQRRFPVKSEHAVSLAVEHICIVDFRGTGETGLHKDSLEKKYLIPIHKLGLSHLLKEV